MRPVNTPSTGKVQLSPNAHVAPAAAYRQSQRITRQSVSLSELLFQRQTLSLEKYFA
jgi:hypothetical protein